MRIDPPPHQGPTQGNQNISLPILTKKREHPEDTENQQPPTKKPRQAEPTETQHPLIKYYYLALQNQHPAQVLVDALEYLPEAPLTPSEITEFLVTYPTYLSWASKKIDQRVNHDFSGILVCSAKDIREIGEKMKADLRVELKKCREKKCRGEVMRLRKMQEEGLARLVERQGDEGGRFERGLEKLGR